jgi:hypothetical protein
MNARPLRLSFSFLALAVLLPACARVEDGPSVTESRSVGEFSAIDLRGAGRLDVLVGQPHSVTVEAGADTLKDLETRVQGDRLVIDARDESFWLRSGSYRVRVTVPRLDSLVVSGATDASIHGFAGGNTKIVVSGAGDLEASGTVDSLEAVTNGAANLNLGQLAATDARVVVNGAGNAKVQASGRLDATVNGVGNIEYLGSPSDLKTAINGIGSIKAR